MMKRLLMLILITGTALLGCYLFQPFDLPLDGKVRSSFDHKVHVEDEALLCTDCHFEPAKGDKVKMPLANDCNDCHTGDKKTKEYVAFMEKRTRGEKVEWLKSASNYQDVIFSHKKHLQDTKMECKDCHGNLASSQQILTTHNPSMDQCIKCHEKDSYKEKKIPRASDCSGCHQEIRKEIPPDNHQRMWTKVHGEEFRLDSKNCSYCHSENTCTSCHKTQKPDSHGTQWLHGGHGFTAEVNRDRCATCHSQDSCVRCHQNTRPRSHTASWGSPGNFHCTGCHFPLGDNSCRTCHQGTPSHQTAPQLPGFVPAHSFSTNCFQCHPNPVAINHPASLSSSECLVCHRRP